MRKQQQQLTNEERVEIYFKLVRSAKEACIGDMYTEIVYAEKDAYDEALALLESVEGIYEALEDRLIIRI